MVRGTKDGGPGRTRTATTRLRAVGSNQLNYGPHLGGICNQTYESQSLTLNIQNETCGCDITSFQESCAICGTVTDV